MNVLRVSVFAGVIVLGALAAPASAQSCATTVVIDSKGNIQDPTSMKCNVDEEVKWQVDNQYANDLVVTFTKFKPGNPLKVKNPKVPAKKGAKGSSAGVHVKSKGSFGSSLPYGSYKYTIQAYDTVAKKYLTPRDPELEVTPPPEIGPKGRGRGRGAAR